MKKIRIKSIGKGLGGHLSSERFSPIITHNASILVLLSGFLLLPFGLIKSTVYLREELAVAYRASRYLHFC